MLKGKATYMTRENQGYIRSVEVSNYKAASQDKADKAQRYRNIAKGIEKGKAMIKGMDMNQSIKTLQDAGHYSTGRKIFNALMYGKDSRLMVALDDYGKKVTNSGRKDLDEKPKK